METYNTDVLPINITISPTLLTSLPKLHSIKNKLEALFNFHTMAANWYENEQQILTIHLYLLAPTQLDETLMSLKKQAAIVNQKSDDVVIESIPEQLEINTYIALTNNEQTFITSHKNLLYPLLEKKLRKILNLIANTEQKNTI